MNEEWDMTFVLTGESHLDDQRPYPYTRTTRKQKFVDADWRKYQDSTERIRWHIKNQMQHNRWDKIPRGRPLSVRIHHYTGKGTGMHDRDSDNEQKGILDAMQGIVYDNDGWIDDLEYLRIPSEDNIMVIIKVRVVSYNWLTAKALNIPWERVEELGPEKALMERLSQVLEEWDEQEMA